MVRMNNKHQHDPRRILNPGGSRFKRKEWREPNYPAKRTPPTTSSSKPAEPVVPSHHVIAGYMAHEFLTKGTLLGQKYDHARAKADAVLAAAQSSKEGKYESLKNWVPEPSPKEEVKEKVKLLKKSHSQSYAEVAALVKSGGTHVPGIINPTQLTRWVQM